MPAYEKMLLLNYNTTAIIRNLGNLLKGKTVYKL